MYPSSHPVFESEPTEGYETHSVHLSFQHHLVFWFRLLSHSTINSRDEWETVRDQPWGNILKNYVEEIFRIQEHRWQRHWACSPIVSKTHWWLTVKYFGKWDISHPSLWSANRQLIRQLVSSWLCSPDCSQWQPSLLVSIEGIVQSICCLGILLLEWWLTFRRAVVPDCFTIQS